ncbi:MAG: hypothetical protein J3R72DRAFT_464486 [Linnemannia gamsii]|nr:MAG: hypothetical protein J3R72DRAFT_464486 [Linnemannia gamsii]
MTPPSAPEKGNTTSPPNSPKTSVTLDPISNGNKRKTTSSEQALLPPSKESKPGADDTLFQGGRELWLAKRLIDPEVYLPLQASKDSPAPPSARYKTKVAVHRYLASEFNQQKEHAGFVVDEGKIKNKIAKMSQHFKLAHRFRHSSDFSTTDGMNWRDAVKERCAYYFILEPVWASVWSDGITLRIDSLTNLDGNVITDGNPDGSRSTGTGNTQCHVGGSGEEERSDADTRSGHGQGWVDVITATNDDNTGGVVEEQPDESLERGQYRTATRVTPAFGSQGTILFQADRDEGQKDGSAGSKVDQKSPISDLLKELNALGRYEIDARREMEMRQMDYRKETEMRRMDLIQKTELAEIEFRKAVRLAEINAATKQEKAVLEQEKEIRLEVEKRVLAKEKELERLLDIVRKQLGPYPTQSTAQ